MLVMIISRAGSQPFRSPSTGIRQRLVCRALIVCSVITAFGCIKKNGPGEPGHLESAIHRAPIRILVLQDKTGSAGQTLTPQLDERDLASLVDKVQSRGGELAIGILREQSNRPFTRLTVLPPPLPPTPPSNRVNPLLFKRAQIEFRGAERQFNNELQDWADETNTRIKRFTSEVQVPLGVPADARSSDIFQGLVRGDLFLSEPEVAFGGRSKRYLILISDAVETTHPDEKAPDLRSGARIVLINGAASLGSIASLNPIRFESFRAALDWLDAEEPHVPRQTPPPPASG